MNTLTRFVRSVKFARQGLAYAFATQNNMRIHILAALLASVLTLLLPLPVTKVLFVVAAVALVIICELINTAVEVIVDLLSPSYHPLAKIAKDLAAAAVLVSAFFALLTGGLVFVPLIIQLVQDGMHEGLAITLESIAAAAAVLLLAIYASAGSVKKEHDDLIHSQRQVTVGMNDKHQPDALHTQEQALLDYAAQARENAYVPYSKFAVGSAVLDEDGRMYQGCNVENAAYGSTNCAERSALYHAISRGAKAKRFRMLAVIGDTQEPITPCGACRQVIAELCPPDMPVILGNTRGNVSRTTVAELLPGAFTNQSLSKS